MKLFGILATVGLANADFLSVFDAHDSVSHIARSLFQGPSELIANYLNKPKIELLKRQLNGKIIRASNKALANNPGSNGPKKRKCAKSEKMSVSDETSSKVTNLERRFESWDADFSEAMVSLNFYSRIVCNDVIFQDVLSDLMTEFLGGCRLAGAKWPQRLSDFAEVVSDRLNCDYHDCFV